MHESKIKVLYITGWGRSGSTLLDNILGQIEGFFCAGELRFIWERNFIENRLCGCGVPFLGCEVWRRVMDTAFGSIENINVCEMLYMCQKARTRHLPLLLIPQGRQLVGAYLRKYLNNVEKLYRAIHSCTNSRVIVDSSKFPSYGCLLGMIPAIDLHVVHLIRDARAVAYSWWQRRKVEPDRAKHPYMERHHPIESSLLWNSWNATAEIFWRHSPVHYMALRYEDFIDKPRESTEQILSLVGEHDLQLPFVNEREVKLGFNHTVSGNPNRFRTGTVRLRRDEEWMSLMTLSNRVLVTLLTWPLLMKYKYPLL